MSKGELIVTAIISVRVAGKYTVLRSVERRLCNVETCAEPVAEVLVDGINRSVDLVTLLWPAAAAGT